MLVINGVTRRYGSDKVFDEAGATKVFGSFAYYNKATGARKFIRIANALLQELSGSTWSNVGATAYSNIPTTFAQARHRAYIHNGTDAMSYYNGSTITTFTALSTPTNLTVTPTGAAGSTAYSYRVSAFSTNGETAACARVTTATGNATLSASNYNALAWTAVASAEGYNIYGRKQTGFQETYLNTVYTNAYNDTGADTPVTSKLPPEADTTGGIKAKYAIFTMGRQFVAGVTEGSTYYPTRLYYSGTLNYIDAFNSSDFGGGWTEVYREDGGEIVDIKPFFNGVIVFKTNGIFKFYFTSNGLPALQEITRSHGGCSYWSSQAIDNDMVYVGIKENRIAVYTLGQQENYAGELLRTNELTVFIQDQLTDANRSYLTNIASFYYDDKYGFTYTLTGSTENTQGFILDLRTGGWVKWDGLPMKATHYTVFDNGSTSKLYGGSNVDGYMVEMMNTNRNDDGAAFTSTIGTKFFNLNYYDVEKVFRDPSFWFKYIEGGAITAEVWTDGTVYQGSASLTSTSSGAGAGADLPGSFLAGSMYATIGEITTSADVIRGIGLTKLGRSLGFYLVDSSSNTNWLFMGLHFYYSVLEGKPLKSTEKIILS